ncbi:MAG: histidinol-phosphate transaminase [Halieaceae bacterium]|nr:histidinol-phosphate transaminase [Halieaceae bacterium]
MSRFWSKGVEALQPYVPGEQSSRQGLLKLNTNESPYPPSPIALLAMRGVSGDQLRRYPDPSSSALRQALAEYHAVDVAQVFVGNGSDEVLGFAFKAFFCGKGALCFPDISYSFYPVWSQLFEIQTQVLAVDTSYEIPFDEIPADVGGIIFPNPNAPTGIAASRSQIETLLRRFPDTVVVVDEAYVDYGTETAIELLQAFDNLLIIRTMSKSRGLAGLRVGYAVGSSELIEGLLRIKDSFNSYPIDAIAQAGALASVQDERYFRETVSAVIEARQQLIQGLVELGFEVLPSSANFVLAKNQRKSGEEWQSLLREQNILVRHFNKPRLNDWLRITVGSSEEVRALLQALSLL